MEHLNEFFDSAMRYAHYEMILPRPERFVEWRSNRQLTNEYCEWIMHSSNCPSLRLDIDVPHQAMLEEVMKQKHMFVKHRGDDHPGWYSMTIHGQDVHLTQDMKWYIEHNVFDSDNSPPYQWTKLADLCPVTKDWLETCWPFSKFNRVRFMLLEPGGYIEPHTDYENRRLAAFNVAISNPPGVEFAMEEAGLIPWEVGDARGIDIGRMHAVRNIGTEPRIHMIIHGLWGNGFHELVCRSYDKLLESIS